MVMIQLRRRGMNYYTDYAERYMDTAFSPFGWHYTLRSDKAEWSCRLLWDNSPWLTFTADWLANLSADDISHLAELLASAFKTISQIIEGPLPQAQTAYTFGFTKGSGAINEPPFLQVGKPLLAISSHSAQLCAETPALFSYQNFGGIASGLHIRISLFNCDAALKELCLLQEDKLSKGLPPLVKVLSPSVQIEQGKQHLSCYLPDFELPEGVNRYSRKLVGKARQDQWDLRQFSLRFIPTHPTGAEIAVWPSANPENIVLVQL